MPATTTNIQRKSYLTRVLTSGNQPKNGERDDNNNNDIITYSSPSYGKSLIRSNSKNLKRANEELRSHVIRLKAEIELEKIKAKQIHRDKVSEVKRIKESYERANSISINLVTEKMKNINELDLKKLRDSLTRDKDLEIKQIIKYKDEEIKTLQKTMQEQIDNLQHQNKMQRNRNLPKRKLHYDHDNENVKLKNEIVMLQKSKEDIEDKLKNYITAVNQKNEMIKKLKDDHERELQKLLREARRVNSRSVSEMQTLRKSLQEKQVEMTKLEVYAAKLNEEKESLPLSKTFHVALSDSQKSEQGRDLRTKNIELKKRLDNSTKRIKILEKENQMLSVHSTSQSIEASRSSKQDNKMKDLRRRNAELVAIAKKLEEKVKQTQQEYENYKSQCSEKIHLKSPKTDMSKLKKSYTIQRAKDLAEHAKVLLLKDKEIEELRKSSQAEATLDLAGSTFEETKSERDAASIEIEELQMIHSECVNTKEKLETKTQELEEVELLLRIKEEECQALTTKIFQSDKEMGYLKMELEEKQQQFEKLEVRNKINDSTINTLEKENNDAKKRLRKMERLEKENILIKAQLDDANKECEEFQTIIDQLKDAIQSLNHKLLAQERRINEMVMETTDVQQKLCERDAEICNLNKMQCELRTGFNETISDMKRDLEISRKKNQNLQDEMSQINKSHQEHLHQQHQQCKHGIRNIAVQTSIDYRNMLRGSPEGRYSSDNVFDEPSPPPFNEPAVSPKKTPIGEESGTPYDGADEDFSIKSENIMEIAASRINELAASASETEATSVSISNMKPPLSHNDNRDTDDEISNEELPLESEYHKSTSDVDFLTFKTDVADVKVNISRETEVGDDLSLKDLQRVEISDVMEIPDTRIVDAQIPDKKSGTDGDDEESIEEAVSQEVCSEKTDELSTLDIPTAQEFNSMIEKLDPNQFPVRLFQAKYTYDPTVYSPNQDHELELPLVAGSLIYVYGEIDDDGFYIGELKSGRRGLVPSNLIERVEDDYAINKDAPFDVSDPDLTEEEYLSHTHDLRQRMKKPLSSVEDDVALLLSTDTNVAKKAIPPPRDLQIERQLNSSVVIKWTSPQGISTKDVKGYSIYVDHEFRQTVLGSARTKALVTDLVSNKTSRISLRTITHEDEESVDEHTVVHVDVGDDMDSDSVDLPTRTSISATSPTATIKTRPETTATTTTATKTRPETASDTKVISDFFDQLKTIGQSSIERRQSLSPRVRTVGNSAAHSPPVSSLSTSLDRPTSLPAPVASSSSAADQKLSLGTSAFEEVSSSAPSNVHSVLDDTITQRVSKATHFNPENDPSYQRKTSSVEERVIIEDEELSVIEEESDNDVSITGNVQTETFRTNSSDSECGSLLHLAPEKAIFSTEPSKQVTKNNFSKSSQETLVPVTGLSDNFSPESRNTSISKFSQKQQHGMDAADDVIISSSAIEVDAENTDFSAGFPIIDSQHLDLTIQLPEGDNPKITLRQSSECSNEGGTNYSNDGDTKSEPEDPHVELSEFSDSIESNVSMTKEQLVNFRNNSKILGKNNLHSKNYSVSSTTDLEKELEPSVSKEEKYQETYNLNKKQLNTGESSDTIRGNFGILNSGVHSFQQAASNNSSQLDTEELINFLEKDAQRDILGDYPDLPLDVENQNEASTYETEIDQHRDEAVKVKSTKDFQTSTLPPKPLSRHNSSEKSRRNSLKDSEPSSQNTTPILSSKSKNKRTPLNSPRLSSQHRDKGNFDSPRDFKRNNSSRSSTTTSPSSVKSETRDDPKLSPSAKSSHSNPKLSPRQHINSSRSDLKMSSRTWIDSSNSDTKLSPRERLVSSRTDTKSSPRERIDSSRSDTKLSPRERLVFSRNDKKSSPRERIDSSRSDTKLSPRERLVSRSDTKSPPRERIDSSRSDTKFSPRERLVSSRTDTKSSPRERVESSRSDTKLSPRQRLDSSHDDPRFSPRGRLNSSHSDPRLSPKDPRYSPKDGTDNLDSTIQRRSPEDCSLSLNDDTSMNNSVDSHSKALYSFSKGKLSPEEPATIAVVKSTKASPKLTGRVPTVGPTMRKTHPNQTPKSINSSSNPLSESSDIDEDSIESDIMFSSLKLSSVLTASASNSVDAVDSPTDDENMEEIRADKLEDTENNDNLLQMEKIPAEGYRSIDDSGCMIVTCEKDSNSSQKNNSNRVDNDTITELKTNDKNPEIYKSENDTSCMIVTRENISPQPVSSPDHLDSGNTVEVNKNKPSVQIVSVPESSNDAETGEDNTTVTLGSASEGEQGDGRRSPTRSAKRTLKHEIEACMVESGSEDQQSDVTDDLSEPIEISRPVKNMYSLTGYDVSSASDVPSDDNDAFDVTPMGELDDTDSRTGTSLNRSDIELLEPQLASTAKKQPTSAETGDKDQQIKIPIERQLSLVEILDAQLVVDENMSEPTSYRIFIALYTYDPKEMSPNVDYIDDELGFKKGDLIKVLDDTDEDGFYFGELNGQTGMIPGNMIAEINTDEQKTEDSFDLTFMVNKEKEKILAIGENNSTSMSASVPSIAIGSHGNADEEKDAESPPPEDPSLISQSYLYASQSMPDLHSDNDDQLEDGYHNDRIDPYKLPPQLTIALYDYDPAVSSPNVDSEIELAFKKGARIEVFGDMDEDGFYPGKLNGRKGLVPSNFILDEEENDIKMDEEATQAPEGPTKIKKKRSSLIKKSKELFSKLKGGKSDK